MSGCLFSLLISSFRHLFALPSRLAQPSIHFCAIIIIHLSCPEGSRSKCKSVTRIASRRNYLSTVAPLSVSIAGRCSIRNIAVDHNSSSLLRKLDAFKPRGTMTRVPSDPYTIQLVVASLSCGAVKTIFPFGCLFVMSNGLRARAFISHV